MEKYLILLGLIFCAIAVVRGAFVTVNREHMFVKPGEKVTLECTGSEPSLSYYIKNRVIWDFIDMNGERKPISDTFYPATNSPYATEGINSGHFAINYRELPDGSYAFLLNITAVAHGDDGVYQCSLITEAKVKESSQNVTVHVLHPVDQVRLEISQGNMVKTFSKEPLSAAATPFALTPGDYNVACKSSGSNPAPVMTLEVDEVAINTQPNTIREIKSSRVQYQGVISERVTLNAKAQNQDVDGSFYVVPLHGWLGAAAVTIVRCTSNIGGNNYPDQTAAVLLRVEVDRPNIVCANFTHARGDRYRSIQCNMTATGGLTCDKVFWVFGDENMIISPSQSEKYKDPTGKYDIMQASCAGTESKLATNLTFYELKEAHFQNVYYLNYGTGDSAHRQAVPIYEDTTAGTSALVPLSFLATIVMAIVSKHLL